MRKGRILKLARAVRHRADEVVLKAEVVARFVKYDGPNRLERKRLFDRGRVGQPARRSDVISVTASAQSFDGIDVDAGVDFLTRAWIGNDERLGSVLGNRRVEPAHHVVADVVGVEARIGRLLLDFDGVEYPDPGERVVPGKERAPHRIPVGDRQVVAQRKDQRILCGQRPSRLRRPEVPTTQKVHVSRRFLVALEINQRLREIADARVGQTRHVPVVRCGDEVIGHFDFDAAGVGCIVDRIGSIAGPSLADPQERVLGEGFGVHEERARRVESVAVGRIRGDRGKLRGEVRDVAEKRCGRNDHGGRRFGNDRCNRNHRAGQRELRTDHLRRPRVNSRERVRPADDDGIVVALEPHDARRGHVRLARRRTEAAQAGCRDRRFDEVLAELRLLQHQIHLAGFAHDRDQAGRHLRIPDERVVTGGRPRGRRTGRRGCGPRRRRQ